jgi:hypothetical protein
VQVLVCIHLHKFKGYDEIDRTLDITGFERFFCVIDYLTLILFAAREIAAPGNAVTLALFGERISTPTSPAPSSLWPPRSKSPKGGKWTGL